MLVLFQSFFNSFNAAVLPVSNMLFFSPHKHPNTVNLLPVYLKTPLFFFKFKIDWGFLLSLLLLTVVTFAPEVEAEVSDM